MSRVPFLNVLRKAFFIATEFQKPGNPSADELPETLHHQTIHRRNFIGDVVKTSVLIGMTGVLNSCRKESNITQISSPPGIDDAKASNLTGKKTQPKIVIIGAGLAGLNCAYHLQKKGLTSTIYEASSRAGGRVFTQQNLLAQGLSTELGGEFIDSIHKDMLNLATEFNLPLIDTLSPSEAGYERDSFFINGQFYSETQVINAFLPYAHQVKTDINSLPSVMTYDNYDATTLHFDSMSISDYLNSIGMTGFLRKGIEEAYTTEYGLETNIQSSINFLFLFSAKTNNGFKIFGESDERYKIQGGNQQVTNALYSQLQNNVYLGQQLVKIKQTNAGDYLLYFQCGNTTNTVPADIVVCTVPFSILRNVNLALILPSWKLNAIQNLGYGTNSKLLLGFNSRVWRNYNYSGYVFTNGAIETGWDNSQGQPGTKGGFTVFQGGNAGLALGNGTPQSQGATVSQSTEPNVGRQPQCLQWKCSTNALACISFQQRQLFMLQGRTIHFHQGCGNKPVGNLYFAGEHCSLDFQGYMNGAAQTGRQTAKELLWR